MTLEEELRHLAVVELELREEFTNVPAYAIHEAIQIEAKAYDKAKVRDYVPVLVARAVKRRLRYHLVD